MHTIQLSAEPAWWQLRERHRRRQLQPKPVTEFTILKAAAAERLYAFLTGHYTIYYHREWQAKLELCQDLVNEGYLKAEFVDHFGKPAFISKDARITVKGCEHLWQLRLRWWSPLARVIDLAKVIGPLIGRLT